MYSTEIVFNGYVFYFVLNRLVPPSHDIVMSDATEEYDAHTTARLRMAYPLWRCLYLSLCLCFIFIFAAMLFGLASSANNPRLLAYHALFALLISYFASSFVIKVLFRMPRGQIVIYLFYVISSLFVETLWSWLYSG